MRTVLFPILLIFLLGPLFSFSPADNGKRAYLNFVAPYQYVQGGSFIMGYHEPNYNQPARTPTRQVTVHSFYLSEKEITVGEYMAFFEDMTVRYGRDSASKYLPNHRIWQAWQAGSEARRNGYLFDPRFRNEPIVGITHTQAAAYCDWLNLRRQDILDTNPKVANKYQFKQLMGRFRLPTEAEWEYAARGGRPVAVRDGDSWERPPLYPWGRDIRQYNRKKEAYLPANFLDGIYDPLHDGHELLAPVGAYPPNDYGLYDMSGNVAEWTANVWVPDAFLKDDRGHGGPDGWLKPPLPPGADPMRRVVKGGSFLMVEEAMQCGAREGRTADSTYLDVGFRVAASKIGSPF